MAPAISAIFAATIFMLIKSVVHVRVDPIRWAVWTSPFFFLIAGTVCALSIVYKGSPNLGLDKKPAWYIATVSLGVGFGLCILSALFFVPYVHAKVIKKDYTLRIWHIFQGPLLFKRPAPEDAEFAKVPNYAVIQHGGDDSESHDDGELKAPTHSNENKAVVSSDAIESKSNTSEQAAETEKSPRLEETSAHKDANAEYKFLLEKARQRHHAELRLSKGPLGWAMRVCHNNPLGAGSIYERHNLKAMCIRFPAYVVIAFLYGLHYDIHKAQVGVLGTPEGRRMDRVYSMAPKYKNEVEYLYSFVQVITACTASFAHGANDVGNAVGVWAGMYGAWRTGQTVASKEEVPVWQIAVVALTICIGFITYGYNIMKGEYYSPFRRGDMLTLGSHGQQNNISLAISWILDGNGRRNNDSYLLSIFATCFNIHVHYWRYSWCWSLQRDIQGCKLAACRSTVLLLGYDHSDCWPDWRRLDGTSFEYPELVIATKDSTLISSITSGTR